jgi:hypothetical protein
MIKVFRSGDVIQLALPDPSQSQHKAKVGSLETGSLQTLMTLAECQGCVKIYLLTKYIRKNDAKDDCRCDLRNTI